MDETVAIAIADDLARSRFAGRLELLGASKFDRGSTERFVEAQWREGKFRQSGIALEDVMRVIAHKCKSLRASWGVSYLAYGSEFKDGITVASVSVDDETGSATWEVNPRPPS